MVAPITGPFYKVDDWALFYRSKTRYKQRKPYTLPLPYNLLIGQRLSATGNLALQTSIASPTNTANDKTVGSANMNQAKILAYERFLNKISDRASMAENLLEYEKTLKVLTSRATQLFQFTRAIKKGNFGQAAHILRSPEPRKRHPVTQSANNWLEFHLGIAPVVGDIYSAMDILQEPIKNVFVRARANGPLGTLFKWEGGGPWSVGLQRYDATQISVQYGAEVAISNPNLYLANKLGIVNPAVVTWQLIPLSFVLDWFVNVEQFLGTGSDLWGLTVLNAFTTYKWSCKYHEYWNSYGWTKDILASGMDRSIGIATPSLGLRPYKATSWQRGLTAISLLVGGLKSLNTKGYDPSKRRVIYNRNNDFRWQDATHRGHV